MCPFAVAGACGRCFVMLAEVNPGQVAKLPLWMACFRVWCTGLWQDWCKNWIRSDVFDAWTMLWMAWGVRMVPDLMCCGGGVTNWFKSIVQRPAA